MFRLILVKLNSSVIQIELIHSDLDKIKMIKKDLIKVLNTCNLEIQIMSSKPLMADFLILLSKLTIINISYFRYLAVN
jgi:hypothetical protein